MRKISCYLLLGLLGALFDGCNKDAIVSPSQPSFTVDNATAYVGNTVTFTVNAVPNAQDVTLFPYGTIVGDTAAQAGVSIDASSFVNGKATVGFSYSKIGTYQAVVISNAHSGNGNTVKNVRSSVITMTVSSHQDVLTGFGLLLNPTIPADSVTSVGFFPRSGNKLALTLQLPFGNGSTQTNLKTGVKGVFTSSQFSKIAVSSTDFSNPVTITVTAADGSSQTVYTLTSSITPAEVTKGFTAQAKDISKSAKNKILSAAVDTVGLGVLAGASGSIVVYDTLGSTATDFDSLRFEYAFKGHFAALKYGGKVLKQDSLFNLGTTAKSFKVYGQDSTKLTYAVYAAAAPKLTLAFNALIPAVSTKTTNFAITADVLNGTDVKTILTTSSVSASPGTLINGITINGVAFNSGDAVDYTKPVVFLVSVTDSNLGGITYMIPFTATVNVVK